MRRALADADAPTLSPDARLARLTVALASLDALPPEEALATLSTLERSTAPRVARRAALERARLTGEAAPDAPVAALVCSVPLAAMAAPDTDTPDSQLAGVPADSASLPLKALSAAHRAAPRACDAHPEAHTFDLGALAPGNAIQLRVPVGGVSRVHLAASGDLVASVQTRRGHNWIGHATSLRPGKVGADTTLPAPDQLMFELPRDALELILTIAPSGPSTRFSLSASQRPQPPTEPSTSSGAPGLATPPTLAALAPVSGPLAPLPSLSDADLFGHGARRLLGLPDLGAALEERLGLDLEGRSVSSTRPLEPSPADLLLALPALTRIDQRVSILSLHLPRATRLARAGQARPNARDSAAASLGLALGHLALDRGHLERARAILDGLAPTDRSTPAARFFLARFARYDGRPEDTLAYYAADPSPIDRFSTLERLELAQAATEIGRADLSAYLRLALADDLPGRLDLGTTAMAALIAAGDVTRALTLADRLADRNPDRPLIALDTAERHLAHDTEASRERALALTRRALSAASLDADALVRAGLLLEALEDTTAGGARDIFARALAASPGHPTARRHLERLTNLEGVARNPLPAPLGTHTTHGRPNADPTPDPRLLALAATPVRDASAPFEILTEDIVVSIAPDGTTTRWVRRVLRAQRVPEQREGRTLRVRFDPSRESVTVLSAFIHRQGPRARRETVVERHVHSLSEDWYGLYYDLRQLSIPFDRLERGDLIEVSWRVDPVGQLFPGVVDLFEILSDRIPKHQLSVTVEHPRSLHLDHRLSQPPGHPARFEVNETIESGAAGAGELRRLTVTTRDLPPLPLEPLAPGAAEVAVVWQVTSFTSWDELARWYTRLIEPSRIVTPAMRELVATLSKGRSKDELIRALTTWVTREIRYVGLEFGIHGYRPYRTDEVLARRFGDCKDKATLLTALLSLAGIESSVVLVRTRKQGRLEGALPSLALFDHAIAWLPSRLQLVDPTAIHHGLGELPREDQGAQILVLSTGSGPSTLEVSPADPASRNGIIGRYAVTIDRLGKGGLSAQVSMLGVHAPLYRAMLLEPLTREKRLEEVLNRRYPGLSLGSLEVSDPADHHRPIDLTFTAEVPRLASRAGPATADPATPGSDAQPLGLQVPRPAGVDGQLERLAAETSRTLPLYLGPPTRWDLRFRYVFPEGYEARTLPHGGEASSPFGHFRVRFLSDPLAPHTVDVETELELAVDQVSAADYPALRAFLAAFDRAVAPALVATPRTIATPTSPPDPASAPTPGEAAP